MIMEQDRVERGLQIVSSPFQTMQFHNYAWYVTCDGAAE